MSILTFRDTLLQENALHKILGKIICENAGHEPQPFIDKETGEEMADFGYCKKCLATLHRC